MKGFSRRLFSFLVLIPSLALAQIGGVFGGSSPAATATTADPIGSRSVNRTMFCNVGTSSNRCAVGMESTEFVADGTWATAQTAGDTLIYGRYTSAATLNATAGWRGQSGDIILAGLPILEFTFRTGPSIAVVRYGIGAGSGNVYAADNDTSRDAHFRFSTAAGDTNWMACSGDGTAGSCEATSPTVAVAASTKYRLRIDCSNLPTSCAYYINGVLVKTKTTNMPATLLHFGTQVMLMASTLEAVAKAIDISQIVISQLQ